jgi:hypothetical protein
MFPLAFAPPPPGTAYVCPAGDFDGGICSHEDLGTALQDKSLDTFELKPGVHATYAFIDRPVTITADEGAVLVGTSDLLGPLFASTGADGSQLVDLVLDGAVSGLATPLGTVFDTSVTFTNLRVSSVLGLLTDVLVVDGATVTLDTPTFESVGLSAGYSTAPIFASDSTVVVNGGSFAEVSGSLASAVHVQDGTLVVDSASFSAATNGSPSFFYALESDVTLTEVSVTTGDKAGFPLLQVGGSLTVEGGTYTGTSAVGALLIMNDGPAVVDGARFELAAGQTGLQVSGAGPTTVIGATFDRVDPFATQALTAAFMAFSAEEVEVSDTWFCGTTGGFGGAAYLVDSCRSSQCLFDRDVFQGAIATSGGAGLFSAGSNVTVSNGTFVGSAVGFGAPGAAIQADAYSVIAVDTSLFVGSLYGTTTVWAPDYTVAAFFDNVFDLSEGFPTSFNYDTARNPTGAVVFEPGPGRCGGSVRVDAVQSDPFIVANQVGAEPVCALEEIPRDSIDQDCDGTELCPEDADGDRFGSDALVEVAVPAECAPTGDCDDGDADVYPGAGCEGTGTTPGEDFDGDGVPVDEDCNDANAEVGRCRLVGGGCATGDPGAGWIALALAALAVTRRR